MMTLFFFTLVTVRDHIKKKKRLMTFSLIYRVETVGQPDRRDSIGVCAEKQNGYDSLQRDQAVCISTNGKRDTTALLFEIHELLW